MSDVLSTIRDAFENVVAPSICGLDQTLVSKIRKRMYHYIVVNYVAKQVENSTGDRTFACEDLAKYMVEALERLNVHVVVD